MITDADSFYAATPAERARWVFDVTNIEATAMHEALRAKYGVSCAANNENPAMHDAVKAARELEREYVAAAGARASTEAGNQIRARRFPKQDTPEALSAAERAALLRA